MTEEFSLDAWMEKLYNFSVRPVTSPQLYLNSKDPSSSSSSSSSASGNVLHRRAEPKQDSRRYLPEHLLHTFISFTDTTGLSRAACVCKQWREVSAHEDFWRCLNFKDRNISELQFSNICRRYTNAIQLNLYGIPHQLSLMLTAFTYLKHLETLIVGGTSQLDYSILSHPQICFPALTTLRVSDTTLINEDVGHRYMVVKHDRLQNLHITHCNASSIFVIVKCPRLVILSMKGTEMAHFHITCPQLLQLDVGFCPKLRYDYFRFAATSCPLLTSLDISNCSNVTQETLSEIARRCTRLQSLIALQCANISFESVRLPMLKVLITSAFSMVAISHFYLLEVLELDGCASLESVTLQHKKLQSFRLRNCHELINLNLQTPMLSSITISSCPSLHQISLSTDSLQKLVLQRQEGLTNLSLNCPILQVVELAECNNLLYFVFDCGGCPTLRSLVLDSCKNLTALKVCSTSVVSLSLVDCCAVIALELACPCLEKVNLNDCDHLETASFSPVGLRSLNLGMFPKLRILQIDAPNMLVLELMGCGVLLNASLYCPLMKLLNASFCRGLTDNSLCETAASCPLIESLILTSCSSIGPDGLTSLGGLHHLALLDVSYTNLMDLLPIFECCLNLKVLKVQACKYLTDSSLEPLYRKGALLALSELDLSYGSFSQSVIEELLVHCTHLRQVSLNGCVNMDDFNVATPGYRYSESSSCTPSQDIAKPINLLESLNMVGCPNIKKVVIRAVSYCDSFSSLNLSLSVNLRVVEIASVTLNILNLSRCCSLEILKLDCPRLTNLVVRSSSIAEEVLEAAISHCSTLKTLDVRYCPQIHHVSTGRLRTMCPSLKCVLSSSSIS